MWLRSIEDFQAVASTEPGRKLLRLVLGEKKMPKREKVYSDKDLKYAATSRCPCGAGLAYPKGAEPFKDDACWDCSDILTGRAIPKGEDGSVQHTARLPFTFYEIKSEDQPSAQGATTRPGKSP